MKSQLSKNKDTDREILSKLDDKELLKICSIDKYTWNNVCDENFLKRRLSKYPEIEKYKLEKESWKQFFLNAVHYIALIKEKYKYEYTFGDFKKQYNLLKKYNKNMNELLIGSAGGGELALVIWSLKNGAVINTRKNNALKLSCGNGHMDVVKYLIDHGADIHSSGDFALVWASENAHYEVVRYLVEHGADIHGQDDGALRMASFRGHYEVVKYLVEHGADIHSYNDDAFRYASRNGHSKVADYLIEHGANVHVINDLY